MSEDELQDTTIEIEKSSHKNIPWVEKYRPSSFKGIILDPVNRRFFENMIANDNFSNMLFYGPPGTGKTTTIVDLINEYATVNNIPSMGGLIIHLNASNERGIGTVRTQIYNFVNSGMLFNRGMKFVIFDEVDYMTKGAQQALRQLMQSYIKTVRFCLICNYISKIDTNLQSELVHVRFNPQCSQDIRSFLRKICDAEMVKITDEEIEFVQRLYKSDMRSMINYIQLNYHQQSSVVHTINNNVFQDILNTVSNPDISMNEFILYMHENICAKYNDSVLNIINQFMRYFILFNSQNLTSEFLDFVENIAHMHQVNDKYIIMFMYINMRKFIIPN